MAPRTAAVRLAHSVVAQHRRTLRCPPGHRLDGCLALVTGGNKGIGAAVTDELANRGSRVIVAAREVSDPIDDRTGPMRTLAPRVGLRLDLSDLNSVGAAVDLLVAKLDGALLDVVVLNAGVIPGPGAVSAQGHERAFAVNVLGHHVLLQRLHSAGVLATPSRIVGVTGDIQVLARDCSPDFINTSRRAGWIAYARSKLGTTWLYRETARRHPDMTVIVVHPGVVSSGLAHGGAPGARRRGQLTKISPPLSAETILCAVTQPLPSGSYLHNTLGVVELRAKDPAGDDRRGAAFVARIDELAAPWLAPRASLPRHEQAPDLDGPP
jgi:NAD(P)-dependent dehydrogenase (short-subunit alcohol dehydrogenase family)